VPLPHRFATILAPGMLVAAAVVSAQSATAHSATAHPATASSPPGRAGVLLKAFTAVHSCAAPRPGYSACDAVVARPAAARAAAIAGLTPTDIRSAYRLPSSSGGGLVAIVDAYDDPRAESDLAAYRAHFGLPACTTANGCFRKVNQAGLPRSFPAASTSWSQEIALDLDAVSAACPGCKILLVEANSARNSDLGASIAAAARFRPAAVSNSFGSPESSSQRAVDAKIAHLGIALVASSGDDGYGAAQFPASSTYFTAVGGTSLKRSSAARGWTETVWGTAAGTKSTGSGCSSYEAKPSWQPGAACGRRMIVDVAADADPATGLAVYDTYGEKGWLQVGGTSLAAPIIASVYARAGNTKSLVGASHAYANRGALFDVTSGVNGKCAPGSAAYLCHAEAGYDGPSGLGTPNGLGAF
jgi:subtilase family serine protease